MSARGGARTRGPEIKSLMLYQLSYTGINHLICGKKRYINPFFSRIESRESSTSHINSPADEDRPQLPQLMVLMVVVARV